MFSRSIKHGTLIPGKVYELEVYKTSGRPVGLPLISFTRRSADELSVKHFPATISPETGIAKLLILEELVNPPRSLWNYPVVLYKVLLDSGETVQLEIRPQDEKHLKELK